METRTVPTDCTDADSDGYCVGVDCDDSKSFCTTDCTDADSDGYCVPHDCDDSKPNCTTDCTDTDSDGYCVTHDCDETTSSCTADCTDGDSDGLRACDGDCDDADSSVYPGASQVCDGVNNDCDDPLWPALGPSNWDGSEISTTADGAGSVFAADLDSDGDLDVLSASGADDKIAWYENADADSDGEPDASWTARPITALADGAISVFAADVDGDGDPDVLSASELDDKVAWYENADTNSDGVPDASWTARTITTGADRARSVYAADVDGDGDLDALSASFDDDTIAWYENADLDSDGVPDASWTARPITTSADGAISVFAGDVDSDGDLDVLSASYYGNEIAWYENADANSDGVPEWTARTITTAINQGRSVYAADVDGDGDLDALSASFNDDTIAWYENADLDSDGVPDASWTARTITTGADGAVSVFAADVDGDGDVDALSASFNDDTIAWYENGDTDSDGVPEWTAHTLTTAAAGAHSVYVADVDGDGDLDALSASMGDDKIAWYRQGTMEDDEDGDGLAECDGDCDDSNENCTTDCTDADSDGYCVGIDCSDFDPNNWIACSTCLDADSDAYFDGCDTYSTINGPDCDDGKPNCTDNCTDADSDGYCGGADCSDLDPNNWVSCLTCTDGDGDLDLVAGNSGANRLYLNDGAGSFGAGSNITADAQNSYSVVLGDVDGDGDLDLVAGNDNEANRLYLNDGTGAFPTGSNITGDTGYTISVVLGDVDGDGDLDLVAGNYIYYNRLYLNDGTGSFGAGSNITADAHYTNSVVLGDVDGDGDLDLVAGNYNFQANRLYLNDGAGSFGAGSNITADAHYTYAVALGDVDGDGDLDLVAGNFSETNRLYLNNGTADPWSGVTGSDITTYAHYTFSVVLGDVDGDGDLDLVAGNSNQANRLYLNDGTGSFGADSDITADAQSTRSVVLGDVDGDGNLDLVAGNSGANRLYLNNGTADPWNGVTGSNITGDTHITYSVALGDVDGDGDGFYIGCDAYVTIPGPDCDVSNPNCTTDCTDADSDGYCVTTDCDEGSASCTGDCTDADFDGTRACDGDCDETNPDCTGPPCTDADSDGICVTHDCDDGTPSAGSTLFS